MATLTQDLKELYNRTMNNCDFYKSENNAAALLNEIGVLRGIGYCMDAIGITVEDTPRFAGMIIEQNKLRETLKTTEQTGKRLERKYEEQAERFSSAIISLAASPANMDNFKYYLSIHFAEWLEKMAATPEDLTSEFECFASMDSEE